MPTIHCRVCGVQHSDQGPCHVCARNRAHAKERDRKLKAADPDRLLACLDACDGIEPTAVPDMVAALRIALGVLDIGDCESGGDYHSSAVGRHCDEEGGRRFCPACIVRRALARATRTD